jgi:hypothetical protein
MFTDHPMGLRVQRAVKINPDRLRVRVHWRSSALKSFYCYGRTNQKALASAGTIFMLLFLYLTKEELYFLNQLCFHLTCQVVNH